MGFLRTHKDLDVWKKAIEFVTEKDRVAERLPPKKATLLRKMLLDLIRSLKDE
jgi:hypothetical protein